MTEPEEFNAKLAAEAGRLEEDCNFSSTGQFVAARRWRIAEYLLDLPAVLLAALAAFFAFTEYSVTAGILSTVILLLMTASLFLRPTERALRHKGSAEKYLALRAAVRVFRDVELTHLNRGRDRLTERLISLVERKNELNVESPPIPVSAYKKAKAEICEGRSSYQFDLHALAAGTIVRSAESTED
jgi:hypothetical protein